MTQLYKLTGLIALFLVTLSSCKKDKNILPEPAINLLKVGSGNLPGGQLQVELWSDKSLITGYNKIYILLKESSGKNITNARVWVKPIMDMQMNNMQMSHSSPVEYQDSNDAKDGLFNAAVVFTMPSTGEEGKWRIEVKVETTGSKGEVNIPVEIKPAQESRISTVKSKIDEVTYLITMVEPVKPTVGINNFEVLINKRVDGMNFPATDDLLIEAIPEMPDMGHGSPNNVNPVGIGRGHYQGKLNFTMTGYWKVNLLIKNKTGEVIADDAFFNVTF
jgi:hypothetical protein